jgi:hypothetical protein
MNHRQRAVLRVGQDNRIAVCCPNADPQTRTVGDQRIPLTQATRFSGFDNDAGVDLVESSHRQTTQPIPALAGSESVRDPVQPLK